MWKRIVWTLVVLLLIAIVAFGIYLHTRYRVPKEAQIPLNEMQTIDYPEDPADRSPSYGRYSHRTLTIQEKENGNYNLILQSDEPHIATLSLENIDLGLFVPTIPIWIKGDRHLEIITLTEREWNRQQAAFKRNTPYLKLEGGNGFETNHLVSAELANNCLNAGLWEILLYSDEEGRPTLYYQGWFHLPLGIYRKLFEKENGVSYWKHWSRLEHWRDPEGMPFNLAKLRTVVREEPLEALPHLDEPIPAKGEQKRKLRTTNAPNVHNYADVITKADQIFFATFAPPGRYRSDKPWSNAFQRFTDFQGAVIRQVKNPSQLRTFDEIELAFLDPKTRETSLLVIGGIDMCDLPHEPSTSYDEGLLLPMCISLPPVNQAYEVLKRSPPRESPYYSVLLDQKARWLNHHAIGIDGISIFRNLADPNQVELFLLSYERHMVFAHCTLNLPPQWCNQSGAILHRS